MEQSQNNMKKLREEAKITRKTHSKEWWRQEEPYVLVNSHVRFLRVYVYFHWKFIDKRDEEEEGKKTTTERKNSKEGKKTIFYFCSVRAFTCFFLYLYNILWF